MVRKDCAPISGIGAGADSVSCGLESVGVEATS